MIHLASGDDRLVVAPEHGGAILEWTRRGTHLLRHPSPHAIPGRPDAVGCVPLVPYCNRIAWRRFNWDGRAYELAANFGDHPHAIHGVGWQSPWLVQQASDDETTLTLRHDAAGEASRGWPFAFASRLTYRLTEQGLTIRIEATNLHPAPAPMGIGAHPWFPRTPGATIAFQADGIWLTRDSLPVSHAPVPPEWNHTNGRSVDREPLDNCFTCWHGEARLSGVRIEADRVLSNLQVYTPAGADFFCVEPVSHAPNAINQTGLPNAQGMTVLAVGGTLSGSMTFTPNHGFTSGR